MINLLKAFKYSHDITTCIEYKDNDILLSKEKKMTNDFRYLIIAKLLITNNHLYD